MGRESEGFASSLGGTPPPPAGIPLEFEVDNKVLSLEPGLPDIIPGLEIGGGVSIHTKLEVDTIRTSNCAVPISLAAL
jgi:hypothetical protein